MRFDIIITNWNRLNYLKRTVGSLIMSGAFTKAERVIIVDNGSTEEGVHDFLEDLHKQYGVYLVLRPHNNGWGVAVNDALGLSRAPYLLVSNNDVEYRPDFHERVRVIFETQPLIGILGVWRHASHGLTAGGVKTDFFHEMDDVPAVGWFMPKSAMMEVGMLPEHGPCFTKGGNGEDSKYVQMMKAKGFLVGVPPQDIASHIDGY